MSFASSEKRFTGHPPTEGPQSSALDDSSSKPRQRSAKEAEYGDESTYEVQHSSYDTPPALKRQLKNRHIAMISIGGVIGTGLFLGTANSLASGGPVGLLLGYLVVGTVTYCTMISLGEMISYLPIEGGHIKLAERFVDPAFAFAMGWNYWYNWAIALPTELSAAAVLVDFWTKSTTLNPLWISICMIVVMYVTSRGSGIHAINSLGAGAYGEAEFVFASIKVITIVGLIILGIVLDLGGGPNHDRVGFRYWKHPGPFVQFHNIAGPTGRFLGFWTVLTQAAFAFIGTEIVAIAAGEAKNPRRNIPKAIRRVYIRIVIFYLGGVIIIGLLVPSNNPLLNLSDNTAASSPFVIAIQNAGIKGLPGVINAALLTSAWSAASSDMYTSSRALYGLSLSGNAPHIFSRTMKNGLPVYALLISVLMSLLSFMGVSSGSGKVFGWFSTMTSIAGLLTWFGIAVTYIRFYAGMKVQQFDRTTLPFYTRLQPFAAWYAACATAIIVFFNGWSVFLKGNWETANFITSYLPLILFPILYAGSRLWLRVSPVAAQNMDFVSGIAEIEAAIEDDPPPKNAFEKFWAWLM